MNKIMSLLYILAYLPVVRYWSLFLNQGFLELFKSLDIPRKMLAPVNCSFYLKGISMPCFHSYRFNSVRKWNPWCNPNLVASMVPKTTSSAKSQIHILIICKTNMKRPNCNFSGPGCWGWIKELSAAKLSRPVFVYIFCLLCYFFYYI